MNIEQVRIKCTDNGREMLANLVNKSETLLVVFLKEADTKLTMSWNGKIYVASKMGLEFTSVGVVEK